jgi:hypothetical protein
MINHSVSVFSPDDEDSMYLRNVGMYRRRQNTEQYHHHPHRRKNLKFNTAALFTQIKASLYK